ncbi:MAG TPA: hypothetical protein DCP69_10135 [Candidatus Omnitrophica bacterium]|nr:hypothetical protein [Candidatus Omnitrophota bacterium]
MSGGSYDYAYSQVERFRDQFRQTSLERRAFARVLTQVAKAMHDIEWVDDGDYGEGEELPALRALLTPSRIADAALAELEAAITEAQRVSAMLRTDEGAA